MLSRVCCQPNYPFTYVRRMPIEDMWRITKLDKDLRAPPQFGDHGMSKNRFARLRALAGQLWDVSATVDDPVGMDADDVWCWSRRPPDKFNEHYTERGVCAWHSHWT